MFFLVAIAVVTVVNHRVFSCFVIAVSVAARLSFRFFSIIDKFVQFKTRKLIFNVYSWTMSNIDQCTKSNMLHSHSEAKGHRESFSYASHY